MNQSKKDSPNQQLSCEICEIDSMSNAEYALHEFTKKHCDNLVRLSKNKPIIKKQKIKSKSPEIEKEPIKVNTVTHAGSFAKYGYFIPGEIYAAAKEPKEFNTDYDPYLQKFAESPFKEQLMPLPVQEFQQNTSVLPSVSVSKKKKKKKNNIRTCQICNLTLLTVPTYEAHMKSPEHIWKLKMSGMGVSAHFVKASSDLHTTDTKEDEKVTQGSTADNQNSMESLLYCDVCELLLNSSQQYVAHMSGKYHTDCFKKKIETEQEMQNPPVDQLFCYTCNILLNTVFQYNEHKNGKKHKIKCRALIRKGMTVPPEERVPGIGAPNCDPSQPIYPELYLKMLLERQKRSDSNVASPIEIGTTSNSSNSVQETTSYNQNSNLNPSTGIQDSDVTTSLNHAPDVGVKMPNIIFHKINFVPAKPKDNPAPASVSENDPMNDFTSKTAEVENVNKEGRSSVTILNAGESLHCSICDENFQWQVQFDAHLTLESHLKKIIEMKISGRSDNEILNLIFSDRNVIKPNNLGRLTCNICKVTANCSEFEHHLSSVVHKYTEKDYRQKRTIEVKNMTPCDENGMYYCKLCKFGWSSLVEFNQHLFSAKHKSIQKRKKTTKCISQGQRLTQNLKRKYMLLQSLKSDKNPGIRTKISGLATDLQTGAQSKVPNLELLEPKIESTKNVSIGVSEKSNTEDIRNLRKPDIKNRGNLFKRVHNLKQSNSGPMPPSLLSCNFPPSVDFPRYPRAPFGRLPYPPPRNAPPFYNPPAFRPFYGRPLENPFYRAHCFRRLPWCNYR